MYTDGKMLPPPSSPENPAFDVDFGRGPPARVWGSEGQDRGAVTGVLICLVSRCRKIHFSDSLRDSLVTTAFNMRLTRSVRRIVMTECLLHDCQRPSEQLFCLPIVLFDIKQRGKIDSVTCHVRSIETKRFLIDFKRLTEERLRAGIVVLGLEYVREVA